MGVCTAFFGIGYMTWVQWSSIRLHTRGRPRVTKYFRPRTPTFSWYASPSWAHEEGQRSCLPWLSLFDFAGRIVRYRLLPCPKSLLSLSLGIWCNTLARWVQCTAQTLQRLDPWLGHLSTRLLWSQQFFELAAVIVISQLYRASIDQLQMLWQLWVKMLLTTQRHLSVFFIRKCVPRVPNIINYIFSTHLHLYHGNRLSLSARNKALCQRHTLCECDHSSLMERDLITSMNQLGVFGPQKNQQYQFYTCK